MEPLIRLMKSVIRRFGKAAYKNHELLTEALFQHAHVQSFIMEVDSVYEASAYSSSYRAGTQGLRFATSPLTESVVFHGI